MRQLKIEKSITNRDTTSLNTYFNEISAVDLISAEEEVELAKKIQKGDTRALDRMVITNLRFVVSVAKQYQHLGVSLSDLISEGNLGLIKAAHRFDPTKGFKFISYAVWWIRQSIIVAIQKNGRIVRLPANRSSLLMKISKFEGDFLQQNERLPSSEEIAENLELKEDLVRSTLVAKVSSYSLDEPVHEEEKATKVDLLVSEELNNIETEIRDQSLRKDIKRLLRRLDPKEQEIIARLFGIGCRANTLGEIAQDLGLSAERIRQLKVQVMKKLRRFSRPHMIS